MAVSQYDRQTDRELAIGAANGDQRAFAALYDRYFAHVYDLAVRALRHPEVAADVAQTTFQQAAQGLASGQVPEHVRAWLYSIAVSEATSDMRQAAASQQVIDEQNLPSFIEIDTVRLAGVQGVAEDIGYRKLVWDSATKLSPREYALLDLSVRRELSAEEIGAALGIGEDTADTTMTGVRQSFEQDTAVELLTLRGREHCPDLESLMERASAPDAWPQMEHAVAAHYSACEVCRATAASYPVVAAVLHGFALVPATAGLKEVIWGNVAAVLPGSAVAAAAAPPPPAAPVETGGGMPRWLKWALGIGGAILGFLILIGIILLLTGGDDDDEEATVSNPQDIQAAGLDEGDSTTDNVLEMEWERQQACAASSGGGAASSCPSGAVRAYSYEFSTNAATLPDETGDLTGEADSVSSGPLNPGDWWFHIRSQGADGAWTNPEHVGPYNIVAPTPEPTPEPTEAPTEKPTAPPTEKPTAEPTAPPTPSPAPATPTPAP